MPAPAESVTTIEELLALPEDGLRHELLDGEHVVTPAPRPLHQQMVGKLFAVLDAAAEDRTDIAVYISPADVRLGSRSLVQPDLFVIRSDPNNRPEVWADVGVPILAIEVLSPRTAARDRGTKRRVYQRAEVNEYWIVDLDSRLVERWRPEDDRPEICDAGLTWTPPGGRAVSIDLPALFTRVLGQP